MTGILFCILMFTAVFCLKKLYPKLRGKAGESRINRLIKNNFDPDHYALIPNVTLRTSRGTTQIVHIVVSEYGIFVIETKNMDGWIFGSEHSSKWTQVIYRSKHSFPNPLRQNYSHVCALKDLLDIPIDKFIPIVVFTGNLDFKTRMPANVIYSTELVEYMESMDKPVFSRETLYNIICKILDNRLKEGSATDREHIRNIRKRFPR